MSNKDCKIAFGAAVLFEVIIISTAIYSIALRQWRNLNLSLIAIVCLMLPIIITYIANKKKIVLPTYFQLIGLAFVFLAQYLGEIQRFYHIFWWWDLFLHALFGSYGVITGLNSIKGTIRKAHEATERRFTLFTVIFAFSFAVTLGTLWEMFEFTGDYLFKTNMEKGGLEDTSTDLLVKIFAALITAIIYYYRSLEK